MKNKSFYFIYRRVYLYEIVIVAVVLIAAIVHLLFDIF